MTDSKCVLASVTSILIRIISIFNPSYEIPDPLPWGAVAGPLAMAEDALARLDQCLARSPIREGWNNRTHFSDACAGLGLEGALVHVEDLVLHDADLDVRIPTHELTRAHAILRARRRIAAAKPEWALSRSGIAALRGRDGRFDLRETASGESAVTNDISGDEKSDLFADEADEQLSAALAAADAAIAKADRALAGDAEVRAPQLRRDPSFYDLDWEEDERFDAWRTVIDRTRALPPTLAAAIAVDAWSAIDPLQHSHWLGRLLVAALLRERGKTRWHLCCPSTGLKAIPYQRRRAQKSPARLVVHLEALTAAAEIGLKDHDRWLTARTLLTRKLEGRRSTSRLPAAIDYVLARPIVTPRMVADALGVTPRSAQDLIADLGLRETTGRGRYRAWGIL